MHMCGRLFSCTYCVHTCSAGFGSLSFNSSQSNHSLLSIELAVRLLLVEDNNLFMDYGVKVYDKTYLDSRTVDLEVDTVAATVGTGGARFGGLGDFNAAASSTIASSWRVWMFSKMLGSSRPSERCIRYVYPYIYVPLDMYLV